jgi:hippurate hydrolase
VKDNLRRVADGIASAHGAEVTVEIIAGYPVTSNTESFADFTLDVAGEMLGSDKVVRMPNPVMGAEDWSYVLQRVPGSMMFLGGTAPDLDPSTAPANHSNRVMFDEAAMADGIALYAGMALRHLSSA